MACIVSSHKVQAPLRTLVVIMKAGAAAVYRMPPAGLSDLSQRLRLSPIAAGQFEGIRHGRRPGNALTDDVIRGAMRRCRDRDRQTAFDRDADIEAQQLGGDLALIVIHGDDTVELAGFGAQENGIGRKRTFRRITGSGSQRDAGFMMRLSSSP